MANIVQTDKRVQYKFTPDCLIQVANFEYHVNGRPLRGNPVINPHGFLPHRFCARVAQVLSSKLNAAREVMGLFPMKRNDELEQMAQTDAFNCAHENHVRDPRIPPYESTLFVVDLVDRLDVYYHVAMILVTMLDNRGASSVFRRFSYTHFGVGIQGDGMKICVSVVYSGPQMLNPEMK